MHGFLPRQFGVGVEEAVGGDQVHLRVVLPPGQQRLKHACGGGLADRRAAGHAHDEGHRSVGILPRLTQELVGCREQTLARGDLQVDQPSQREEDLFDLE